MKLIKLNYLFLQLILFLCFAFSSSQINAENLEDEIGGLIIDRTITRFGKEFYQDFSSLWLGVKGANKYTIVIIERPLPQSGTVVTIEFRSQKVFQTFFGRRLATTDEKLANQAINVVISHLANILEQSQHPDMLGEGY